MTGTTSSSGTRVGILVSNVLTVVGTLLIAGGIWIGALAAHSSLLTNAGTSLLIVATAIIVVRGTRRS
jgi:hypothetical protein